MLALWLALAYLQSMFRAKAKRLKELIAELGPRGLARTSTGAEVSISTLQKMCAGSYRGNPADSLRKRLSVFFKVPEADIFELIEAGEKSA